MSTNRKPSHREEDFHLWKRLIYVQSHAALDDITFFPELRYHGIRVRPLGWHKESRKPLVACHLASDDLGESAKQIYPSLEDVFADGWEGAGKGEFEKYIHVDELEKIEGPPPDGQF